MEEKIPRIIDEAIGYAITQYKILLEPIGRTWLDEGFQGSPIINGFGENEIMEHGIYLITFPINIGKSKGCFYERLTNLCNDSSENHHEGFIGFTATQEDVSDLLKRTNWDIEPEQLKLYERIFPLKKFRQFNKLIKYDDREYNFVALRESNSIFTGHDVDYEYYFTLFD